MDILLVNPYSEHSLGINETTVEVPIGILSLASFLEQDGLRVSILDAYARQLPEAQVMEVVKKLKPKAVGISVNIFSFLQAISYTREIKRISPDIIVIWGGPHPTIAWEICLERSLADFIVLGEGELTLVELMKNIAQKASFNHIQGIAYRENAKYKANSPRERIGDLDSLPMPAYHLLPELSFYKACCRKKPFIGIVTSRGCPFNCIYCSKDVFKSKITMRSPEKIMEEIDLLVNKYKIKQIDILDDNFTMDPNRVEKLCDLIIAKNHKICINLQSGIRADRVNEYLIKKMKKAGVFKLAFGVETGNKEILKSIKKQLDLDKVLEASRLARKFGMTVIGFFMIGLPGDNEKTMQETIDFAIKMNPHLANFMMTIPFYGTELYKRVEEKGNLLVDTKYGISSGFYAAKAYYEMNGLKSECIIKYYKKAYKDFYSRPGKLVDILFSIKSFSEFKWVLNTAINTFSPRS